MSKHRLLLEPCQRPQIPGARLHATFTTDCYDPPKSVAGSFVKEIPGPCEGLTFANDEELEIDDCILAPGGLDYLISRYDEEILFVDQLLGQILDVLRGRKLLDNSIVIVTSDHGEELKDHGSLDHTKTLYQELIHVPLMVRIPRETPKRIKERVSIAQIMPTALELLGVPYTEESLHAVSLFPVEGSERADVFSVTAFSHRFPFRELMYSIVRDRYKLITYENPSVSFLRLYDLHADPKDQRDLSELPDHENTIKELGSRLQKWRDEFQGTVSVEGNLDFMEQLDEETLQHLRSLGYLK